MAVDYLGRDVGTLSHGEAMRQMNVVTKQIVETTSPSTTTSIDNLSEAVAAFADVADKSYSQNAKREEGWVAQIVDFIQTFKKDSTTNRTSNGSMKSEVDYLKQIATSSGNLYAASQSKNTLWVAVCKFDVRAMNDITTAIRNAFRKSGSFGVNGTTGTTGSTANINNAVNMASANRAATGGIGGIGHVAGGSGGGGGFGRGGSSGPTGGLGGPPNPSGSLGISRGLMRATLAAKLLLGVFQTFHRQMVAAVDLGFGEKVFGNLIADSNKFREELRMILHQQIGFTAENRSMEKTYSDLHQSFRASGLTRQKFDELYLRNLQRGLILEGKGLKSRELSAKKMQSITTSAGNTAVMLNMSATATNEIFMDWHQHLALSANDIAEMGRHMQTVARNTGVTGKELEKAMASAAKIQKSLEKAGLAGVSALKNINNAMAIAQKHGGIEKTQELLDAMSSSSNFFNADPNTRALLSRAAQRQGLTEQLQAGTITQSPELTKQMFQGIQADMRDLLTNAAGGAFANMGVDTRTMDLTKLTEKMQGLAEVANRGAQAGATNAEKQLATEASIALRAIDNLAKQRGMTVGELQQQARIASEMSMTAGDRLKQQSDRLAEMQQKGLQNLDEYKQLQRQVMEAQTNAALTGFNQVQNALTLNGANSFADLTTSVQKDLKAKLTEEMGAEGANKFLADIGQSANTMMKSFSDRAAATGLNFQDELRAVGYNTQAELEAALQKGGNEGERAMRSLNQVQQLIARKEQTSQDPATAIREDLREINGYLRKITDGYLFKISNALAGVLYWVGNIAGLLITMIGIVSAFRFASSVAGALGGGASVGGAITTALTGGSAVAAGGATAGTGVAAATTGVLGAIIAPLMLIAGGIKGFFEADSARRTKMEGVLYGALTGGAHTGSMFSSSLGIQKGSTGDKALGVAGAAVWGAVIGAALAPFTGGLSLIIAPIIAIATELFKIFTEGMDLWGNIKKGFAESFGQFQKSLSIMWVKFSGIGTIFQDLYKSIAKMFGSFKVDGKGLEQTMELLGWLLGQVIGPSIPILNLLIRTLENLANIVAGVVRSISGALGIIWNVGKMLIGFFTGNKELMSEAVDGLIDSMKGVLEGLGQVILGAGKVIYDATFGVIATMGSIFTGGISTLPQIMLDGLQSAFLSFPEWMLNNITTGLSGLGTWLYENTIGRIIDLIPEWLKNSGAGATQTSGEQWNQMIDQGPSYTHAMGGIAGGAGEVLRGNVLQGAGKVGGAFVEGVGATGNTILDGTSAILSAINPFNYFEEGTRGVEQGGVAVLHAGEMVVPKNVWDQVKAVGNTAFAGGSGIGKALTNASDSNNLQKAFVSQKDSGLFDKDSNISDAMIASSEIMAKEVTSGGLNDIISSALSTKESSEKQMILAELSRALDYEREASEVAERHDAAISSNIIDYSDEIRGQVSTLGSNRGDIQTSLQQREAGSLTSNSLLLPSMDTIANYLTDIQSGKLTEIAELLLDIKNNTEMARSSNILGAMTGNVRPQVKPGVKSIAQDRVKGSWDLSFGDTSSSIIPTEGRGGTS